jgi:hypothetical protein
MEDRPRACHGSVKSFSFFNEKGQLADRVTGDYVGRELGAYLRGTDAAVSNRSLLRQRHLRGLEAGRLHFPRAQATTRYRASAA